MEATVYLKNLHITAKKLRFLLPEIKKLTPSQALEKLYYSPKKAAVVFYKAIKSAIDNAKYTLKIEPDLLKFKVLTVEQGNALKRYRPGGRGTAKPYKKKYSHIKIVLIADKAHSAAKKIEIVKPEEKKLSIDSPIKRVRKASIVKKDALKK